MPGGFVSMSSWVKRGGRIGHAEASEPATVEWVAILARRGTRPRYPGPKNRRTATPDWPGTVSYPLCCSTTVLPFGSPPRLPTGATVSRSSSDEADHRRAGSGSEHRVGRCRLRRRHHGHQGQVSSLPVSTGRHPVRMEGRPLRRSALRFHFPHTFRLPWCRRAPNPPPVARLRAECVSRRLWRRARARQEQRRRPTQHAEVIASPLAAPPHFARLSASAAFCALSPS
jgi:hypothetical protein